MEECTETGVSSRAERKALEKAKILQREKERTTFKQVESPVCRGHGTEAILSTSVITHNTVLDMKKLQLHEVFSENC